MKGVLIFGPRAWCVVAIFSTAFVRFVHSNPEDYTRAKSIYEFNVKNIHGAEVSLEKYRGHVCIIVNVASECSLTDTNYEQLNSLYERYRESKGLKILAFPTNEFGGQEPGSNDDILEFAKRKGVKFDLFSKVNVNGDNAHPLWKYLKHKQGGFFVDSIKWNFTKFIIDKNGQVVERFAPTTSPDSLVDYLEKYFKQNGTGYSHDL